MYCCGILSKYMFCINITNHLTFWFLTWESACSWAVPVNPLSSWKVFHTVLICPTVWFWSLCKACPPRIQPRSDVHIATLVIKVSICQPDRWISIKVNQQEIWEDIKEEIHLKQLKLHWTIICTLLRTPLLWTLTALVCLCIVCIYNIYSVYHDDSTTLSIIAIYHSRNHHCSCCWLSSWDVWWDQPI